MVFLLIFVILLLIFVTSPYKPRQPHFLSLGSFFVAENLENPG